MPFSLFVDSLGYFWEKVLVLVFERTNIIGWFYKYEEGIRFHRVPCEADFLLGPRMFPKLLIISNKKCLRPSIK